MLEKLIAAALAAVLAGGVCVSGAALKEWAEREAVEYNALIDQIVEDPEDISLENVLLGRMP